MLHVSTRRLQGGDTVNGYPARYGSIVSHDVFFRGDALAMTAADMVSLVHRRVGIEMLTSKRPKGGAMVGRT